jgi:hemerythrin-like domain-containing protein
VKATNELRAEHDGITVMLRIMGAICERIEAGQPVDRDDPPRIVEFLSVFAGRCHHGKEEDLLFPALERCGVPREGGPIGVMLDEHTRGRAFILGMRAALDRWATDDATAARDFAENARGYVALLTQHIEKESAGLFAAADQLLTAEHQQTLFEGFEAIERERIGVGKHEEFHALMDVLADKYLARCPPAQVGAGGKDRRRARGGSAGGVCDAH